MYLDSSLDNRLVAVLYGKVRDLSLFMAGGSEEYEGGHINYWIY